MSISDKIKDYMDKMNLTQYKLSKKSGVGQSTLSCIISGERSPSIETLTKICSAFGVTLSEFFSSGENISELSKNDRELLRLYRRAPKTIRKIAFYSLSLTDENHYEYCDSPQNDNDIEQAISETNKVLFGRFIRQNITIPVVGVAAAGNPIEMIENGDYLESESSDYKPGDFAVIAFGNSMIDVGIKNGDRVLIRPQAEVQDGNIALVAVGDGSTIKRIYRKNGSVILKSENTEVDDQIYTKDSGVEVRVLGKFVAVL